MIRGLRTIAVFAFAFSCAVAHAQDALHPGIRLNLRYSIPVERTRLAPIYAQYGNIIASVLALHTEDDFCMIVPANPMPASALGTNLDGQTMVVGPITRPATPSSRSSTALSSARRSFLIDNDVAAGGTPLIMGLLCSTSGETFTIFDLQRVFGATLDMTLNAGN